MSYVDRWDREHATNLIPGSSEKTALVANWDILEPRKRGHYGRDSRNNDYSRTRKNGTFILPSTDNNF